MSDARIPPEVARAMGAAPVPEQWEAISMPLRPYSIVAGAGSGKTSVMAARIVYLALVALGRAGTEPDTEGVLPGNVLALTFTNQATNLLRRRVRQALEALELAEGEEPTVLNYHGFAAQVLERYGMLAGIDAGLRVLTPAQRGEVCARVLDEMTFEHVEATWQPSLVSKILDLADQAANHRVSPEEIATFAKDRLAELSRHRSDAAFRAAQERIELADAVARFQRLKRDLGAIDFGDQITLALRVAEGFPQVGAGYRERFRAVLLDEYQDTNVAQAALIKAVFGAGFPITVVGDPDQNIYGWRGASVYNLLSFRDDLGADGGGSCPSLPLQTNFRSGARILHAAQRLVDPLPATQRPDPGRRLIPWPANGDGEVHLARFVDEREEAAWIAARIRAIHDAAPDLEPWSGFAVLCRKSRLFAPLQDAIREEEIPAEFVGLTGLLKLPEVMETLAYARAVADPTASVSLGRILLGPRYRVGYKDLARLAAWTRSKNRGPDGRGDEPVPVVLAEALERLDQVEGLSAEGVDRLHEARAELMSLREEAHGSVGAFLRAVIDRTGLGAELDAAPNRALAAAARRNLDALAREADAFAPLQGDVTLRAFLDYVDLVESAERPELAPAQPSAEDSVKVMTVHQAKGLEFETVFVPGLADTLLPDTTIQQNPAERGKSMDFELRGDRDILPAYRGNLSAFKAALKEQELIEERRTCYVALTRARRRLFVTGAYWYGDGARRKARSVFYQELSEWAKDSGEAEIVPDSAEVPDENPLPGYWGKLVRPWPGPARPDDVDGLFPEGWRRAALDASGPGGTAPGLEAADRAGYLARSAELSSLAGHLVERDARERSSAAADVVPPRVSVGGLVDYERCPKRFYWSAVRPLPRFSGPAARLGTKIHAWIERRSSGQASLFELEDEPDLTPEELAGTPGKTARLEQAFERSRFAGVRPMFAERPFLLSIGGFVIAGRIDAAFGRPDGPWEIVDYKTGRRPPPDDPVAGLQLDLYALACVDVWGKRPEDLTLTYFYLSEETEASRTAGDPEGVRRRVAATLRGVSGGEFPAEPGPHCRWCDFLPFCPEGRAYVRRAGGGEPPEER